MCIVCNVIFNSEFCGASMSVDSDCTVHTGFVLYFVLRGHVETCTVVGLTDGKQIELSELS